MTYFRRSMKLIF